MRHLLLFGTILISSVAIGQNRDHWTTLDFLNKNKENPFIPEKNISGLCFIILADNFDYYKRPILLKEKDNKEIVRIEFTESNGLTITYKGKIYKQFERPNLFNPWLFTDNSDYFRLAFECIDTTGTSYKVKLNEKEFALISKLNKDFKKQSITDFVKDWTSLGFDFDRTTNPLKDSPKGNAKTIKHVDEKEYKIWTGEGLEVKGDWIKVKTIKNETGWVKWREGNKVIIRMYFSC